MKKVLSFVLVLALILGSASMVFADEEPLLTILIAPAPLVLAKETTAVPFEDAQLNYIATILRDIGAAEGDENGHANLEDKINRAEAATMLVRAMGLKEEGSVKVVTKFSDVAKESWYSGYVDVASKHGYIDGLGNGTFDPEAQLTMNEAVTMVLKLMGYGLKNVTGTWPENYRSLAVEKKILTGLNIDTKEVTREEFFKLIYNCLDKDVVEFKDNAFAAIEKLYQTMNGEDAKNPILNAAGGIYKTIGNTEVISKDTVFVNNYDASDYYGYTASVLYKVNEKGVSEKIGLVSAEKKESSSAEVVAPVSGYKFITLAAFIDKYSKLNTEGETEYFASFKINGTNSIATYEAGDWYASFGAFGETFDLNVYDNKIFYVQRYKVVGREIGVDVTTLRECVNISDNVLVEDGYIKILNHYLFIEYYDNGEDTTYAGISSRTEEYSTTNGVDLSVKKFDFGYTETNTFPLCANPMIYKYSEESVDVGTCDDVALSKTVAFYDVNEDGFVDIILIDYFEVEEYVEDYFGKYGGTYHD